VGESLVYGMTPFSFVLCYQRLEVSCCPHFHVCLKEGSRSSPETPVTTQCYNPENHNLRIILIIRYITSGTGALEGRGDRGVEKTTS